MRNSREYITERMLGQTPLQTWEPKFCSGCRFHHNLEPDSPREDVWYNNICKATSRAPAEDFITGRKGFLGCNDIGSVYITDVEFEYCRSISINGNCEYHQVETP